MMIIRDPKMFSKEGLNEEASAKNELMLSLNNLKAILEAGCEASGVNENNLLQECSKLQSICKRGLAERCLATIVGADNILIDCIAKILNCNMSDIKNRSLKLNLDKCPLQSLNHLLQTYGCYLESQPDIMNRDIEHALMTLLKDTAGQLKHNKIDAQIVQVAENLLSIFAKFCFMHENNRQSFIQGGVARIVVDLLDFSKKWEVNALTYF